MNTQYGEPLSVSQVNHEIVLQASGYSFCDTLLGPVGASDRIVSCLNALSGVQEPQAALDKARESLEEVGVMCLNTLPDPDVLERALAALELLGGKRS